MACINPDGTLTLVAQAVLARLDDWRTPEELAALSGYPLYRVRGTIRETAAAAMIEESEARWHLTEKGREVLALSAEME